MWTIWAASWSLYNVTNTKWLSLLVVLQYSDSLDYTTWCIYQCNNSDHLLNKLHCVLNSVTSCNCPLYCRTITHTLYSTMQKVNEVFTIGLPSSARGASLQSYNEFLSLCSFINFIIPYQRMHHVVSRVLH